MKAEDVRAFAITALAAVGSDRGVRTDLKRMEIAIAAVAPLIAAAERERCAAVAETHEWFVGGIGTIAPGSGEAKAIAAAIRALGDEP